IVHLVREFLTDAEPFSGGEKVSLIADVGFEMDASVDGPLVANLTSVLIDREGILVLQRVYLDPLVGAYGPNESRQVQVIVTTTAASEPKAMYARVIYNVRDC